ncbi:MAG: CinA family protein [Alphaproteobacteria bacterium]
MRRLARELGRQLQHRGYRLATAESCTGGWLAQAVTSIAGSSAWFERGFVTYSNAAKEEMLGVKPETLARFGAVSAETAIGMAEGALMHSRSDISVAITGIAGPEGSSEDKPVGTVWFAWAGGGRPPVAVCEHFEGGRDTVRRRAVETALSGLIERLQ